MRFKIKYKHNVKLVVSEQIVSSFNLDVINDEAPMVSFISNSKYLKNQQFTHCDIEDSSSKGQVFV